MVPFPKSWAGDSLLNFSSSTHKDYSLVNTVLVLPLEASGLSALYRHWIHATPMIRLKDPNAFLLLCVMKDTNQYLVSQGRSLTPRLTDNSFPSHPQEKTLQTWSVWNVLSPAHMSGKLLLILQDSDQISPSQESLPCHLSLPQPDLDAFPPSAIRAPYRFLSYSFTDCQIQSFPGY